jgi:uncharacterized protein YndB with AHSA1/START domain
MLAWLGIGVATLLGLLALIWFLGCFLAKTRVVSRALSLKQTPEAVWQVIADVAAEPSWHQGVLKVERLPDHDGHETWRQTYAGNYVMRLETLQSVPPHTLVRSFADEKGPFQGRWHFDITPLDQGVRVTITEHGDIDNPFFRFMRMLSKPAMYLEIYLHQLARKFAEPAKIEK